MTGVQFIQVMKDDLKTMDAVKKPLHEQVISLCEEVVKLYPEGDVPADITSESVLNRIKKEAGKLNVIGINENNCQFLADFLHLKKSEQTGFAFVDLENFI